MGVKRVQVIILRTLLARAPRSWSAVSVLPLPCLVLLLPLLLLLLQLPWLILGPMLGLGSLHRLMLLLHWLILFQHWLMLLLRHLMTLVLHRRMP